MKTHTANWDYQRNTGLAPYNSTCPKCGSHCYSSAIPDGMLYTCPECGTLDLQDETGLIASAVAIRNYWDMPLLDKMFCENIAADDLTERELK